MYLVGAFSFEEKSPTITVTRFFRQTTECMRSGHFLRNYWTTGPANRNASE